MKLQVEWSRPIVLKRSRDSFGYILDLSKVTDYPGVYIFGRQWGSGFEALYVGKAANVQSRVKRHLNNLQLMQHLHDAKAGKRVLFAGRFVTKRGQQVDKCLLLTERALIRNFLSAGHDLVNKQGTRIRRHELESVGAHPKRFWPTQMYLERTRGG